MRYKTIQALHELRMWTMLMVGAYVYVHTQKPDLEAKVQRKIRAIKEKANKKPKDIIVVPNIEEES